MFSSFISASGQAALAAAQQTAENEHVKKIIKRADGLTIANYGMKPVAAAPKACSSSFKPSGREMPATVDLRKHCTPIENQSNSNSCCANACAGAYEYLIAKWAEKEGKEPVDVSRLFIYYAGRKMYAKDINKKVQDEGVSIPDAIDAMKAKGACTEDMWPFNLEKVNARPTQECWDAASGYKISEAFAVPVELQAMKQALADGNPIITGLSLTQAFFDPGQSGKIKKPDPSDPQSAAHGLHAMLIVGYSDKQEVFIYRNSWGTSWGDGGYGYVPYSYGADPKLNYCGQYTIKGVTNFDFYPDQDETPEDDIVLDDTEDGGGDEEIIEEEEELPEKEDEEFDDTDLFSKKAELMRVFRQHDIDKSGNMHSWELMAALWKMGTCADPWTVAQILKDNDINESGAISLKEWFIMNGEELPEIDGNALLSGGAYIDDGSCKDEVCGIFAKYDTDGNGKLDAEELSALLAELNPDITPERSRLLFQAADIDSDGLVDYKEFVHWLYVDIDKPIGGVVGAVGGAVGSVGGAVSGAFGAVGKMGGLWG